MRILVAIFILCANLASCTKKTEVTAEKIVIDTVAPDFKIPKDFFLEIKKTIGIEFKIEPEFLFTDLSVQLSSDQSGVLKHSNLEFYLPNGGGVIDLKDYVQGEGSFYMSFPAAQFEMKPAVVHVFYLSNSPKVKIENEEYGLGCGQWIDLKDKIEDIKKNNFLKFNTKNATYIHVMAGQYIFVFRKGVQFYLSHVNITDTRYENKLCTEIFKF